MTATRRQFLQDSVLSGLALMGGAGAVPSLFARACLLGPGGGKNSEPRILVLVELTGGNDGLNTVIPFGDDAYYEARPTLAVKKPAVLSLDDHTGLHPTLAPLKELFDRGSLTVLQGVGYPHPNRSHFTSMDIWHSASLDPVTPGTTGWIGRLLDRDDQGSQNTSKSRERIDPLVVHLDREPLPLALMGSSRVVPSFRDLSDFRFDRRDLDRLESLFEAPLGPVSSGELEAIRALSEQAQAQARLLTDLVENDRGVAEYPASRLAQNLKQIAQLIGAGLSTQVYFTSLPGFDTHSNQGGTHQALLKDLGDSVGAFVKDLEHRGLGERVLLVTLSEFGRRIRENRSRGTDHGAAAPLFVVGPKARPGLIGDPPDLVDTIDGDVRHTLDFRRVYATLLEEWLGFPSPPILGEPFQTLPFV